VGVVAVDVDLDDFVRREEAIGGALAQEQL